MAPPAIRSQRGRVLDVSEPVIFLSLAASGPKQRALPRGTTGSPNEELAERVIQLKVTASSRRMSQIEITFWNEDLVLTESPITRHGTILRVAWGYSGHLGRLRSFKITKVKGSKARVRFLGRITVVATSLECDLNGKPKSRVFRQMTEVQMVRQIARENGISGADLIVGPDDGKRNNFYQTNRTDAEQLAAVAEVNGWVFSFEAGVLTVAPHSMLCLNQPIARYTYYTDPIGWIRRMEPQDTTLALPGSVTVKSTDPRSGKAVSHTATLRNRATPSMGRYSPLLPAQSSTSTGTRVHRSQSVGKAGVVPTTQTIYLPDATASQVKQEAKKRQEHAQLRVNKARLLMIGDPDVWPEQRIHIDGTSPALSGVWRVAETVHTLGANGYELECKLRRDATNRLGKGQKPKAAQTAKQSPSATAQPHAPIAAPPRPTQPRQAPPASRALVGADPCLMH